MAKQRANEPWSQEPDRLDFEADGLKCAMRRGPFGHWCGYVGVPASHPWFGLPSNQMVKLPKKWIDRPRSPQGIGPLDLLIAALRGDDLEDGISISMALEVHGGITWAEDHAAGDEPDGNFWFGFDCAHAGDLTPDLDRSGVYRDQAYVVAECQSLALQLIEVAALATSAGAA